MARKGNMTPGGKSSTEHVRDFMRKLLDARVMSAIAVIVSLFAPGLLSPELQACIQAARIFFLN
jgi:hypothetical protein